MARPKDKEDVILAAATKLFLEKGYANTSIQDIANEAGLAKGTTYDYYKNKEDLFVQAMALYHKQHLGKIDGIAKCEIGFLEKLDFLIDSFLYEFAENNFRWMEPIMLNQGSQLSADARIKMHMVMENVREDTNRKLSEIIGQGIQEGFLRDIELSSYAAFFDSLLVGLGFHLKDPRLTPAEKDLIKEQLIDFVINGMGKK